ncbi:hypothetical protein B0H14DRAFT_3435518 [Mycena olivaceomarginata]|nr:hypothetical protein B0H14DRAFT_3435518 [Mycena olivaceomarginata]
MNTLLSASSIARPVPRRPLANFLIKALNVENPSLITLAISPCWLATGGNEGAARNGLGSIQQAPGKVEDGVAGILSCIDGATKEKSSGRFWNYQVSNDGNPWDINTDEVPW